MGTLDTGLIRRFFEHARPGFGLACEPGTVGEIGALAGSQFDGDLSGDLVADDAPHGRLLLALDQRVTFGLPGCIMVMVALLVVSGVCIPIW